jgi:hypothetical protein
MSPETITWQDADKVKPDHELTVLLWFGSTFEYATGWWDSETWRTCVDGTGVAGVTHWADVGGPES